MKNNKYLLDEYGNQVQKKYIDKAIVKRDAVVERLIKKAMKLQKQMQDFKEYANKEVEKYIKFLHDWNEMDFVEFKGNLKLTNFGKNKKVMVQIHNKLTFNENLMLAKEKIDECISKWVKSDQVKRIVETAFRTDKYGNVDAKAILKLKQLDFNDADWSAAMDLLNNAIEVESTKQYITFYIKDDKDNWKTISLNFSAL